MRNGLKNFLFLILTVILFNVLIIMFYNFGYHDGYDESLKHIILNEKLENKIRYIKTDKKYLETKDSTYYIKTVKDTILIKNGKKFKDYVIKKRK